jgi:hypothetical protein
MEISMRVDTSGDKSFRFWQCVHVVSFSVGMGMLWLAEDGGQDTSGTRGRAPIKSRPSRLASAVMRCSRTRTTNHKKDTKRVVLILSQPESEEHSIITDAE